MKINVVASIVTAFIEAALDPLAWFAVIQFWFSLIMAAILQAPDDDDHSEEARRQDRACRRVM